MWSFLVYVLFAYLASTLGSPWNELGSTTQPMLHSLPQSLPLQPYFEPTPSSVAVRPGQAVQIPCRVRNLGDKIVSWIRRRDLHILSSAGLMFTADARFAVLHPEGDSAAWTLQLRSAAPKDQGLYECQVNTDPKLKQAVLLTVSDKLTDDAMELSLGDDASTAGFARIQGPREQHVRLGSTWTLTCEVSGLSGTSLRVNSPNKPEPFPAKPVRLVDWLQEGQLLTYQSNRGGISIDTEHSDGLTISRLTLANLRSEDTGRYVCKPLSFRPAVVTIIVVEGEKTAMLGQSGALVSSPSWFIFTLLLSYILLWSFSS